MKYKDAIAGYHEHCFSGNVKAGYEFLKDLPKPSKKITAFIRKIENRFFSDKPVRKFGTKIKWIRDVLNHYCDYYVEVMAKRIDPELAEQNLYEKLRDVPRLGGANLEEIETNLEREFNSVGWNFLGGITLPFLGPYIYEEVNKKSYEVELPLGTRAINVYFMSKFHSRSWLSYATFGKTGTGGWAQSEGLFCVAECYDQESEYFQTSYLKHEAQHFDDYERFPFARQNHQCILEYRAKLCELIYARTHECLAKFLKEAKNDPDLPHLFASWKLVKGLSQLTQLELTGDNCRTLGLNNIKMAAKQLFDLNTKFLEENSNGQDVVSNWLKL